MLNNYMFANDFEKLNNLYTQKIITEMNIGPHGDQSPGEGLSVIKPQRVKLNQDEDCEHSCNHEDTNTGMTKQSLFRLVKLSAMLHDLLCAEQNVEPWVLSKITQALNHVESVYGYMDYENYRQQVVTDISNIEEETETDLYTTISKGGSDVVNKLKEVLASESTAILESFLYETINALESKTTKKK